MIKRLFNILSSVSGYISRNTLFAEGIDKDKTYDHWNVPKSEVVDESLLTEEERLAMEEAEKAKQTELSENEKATITENVNKLLELGYTEDEVKQLATDDIAKILKKEGVDKDNDNEEQDKGKQGGKDEGADKQGSPDKTEPVYKFSDKVEIPESKLTELATKTRDEFGADDFDKLPENIRFKLIQKDINIYEGSRNLSRKNQEAATAKKDIAAEKEKIDLQRAEIDKQRGEIEKQLKEIEEQKKKDKETIEADTDDILDVDDRVEHAIEKREAQARLKDADTRIMELKDRSYKLQTSAAEIVVTNYIKELMEAFPELETTKDESGKPRNPIEIHANPKAYAGTDDLKRSLRLSDVITKYLEKGKALGLSITEFYDIEKDVNYPDLKLTGKAQQKSDAQAKAKSVIDVKAVNTANLLKEIFEKAKNSPPNPRGQSSDGNSTVNLQQKDNSAQKKQAIGQHWNIPSGTTGS